MEPEKNKTVENAIENFNRVEQEIDGQQRPIETIITERSLPSDNIRVPDTTEPPLPSNRVNPESALAPGYQPSGELPKEKDLEKKPVPAPHPDEEPTDTKSVPVVPTPAINPKEGAPDIGKNYGDSLGTPGSKEMPIPRENPNLAQTGAATPEQTEQLANRPNALEQSKQEHEQEERKKAGETPEINPEAPNQNPNKKPQEESTTDQPATGNGYGALNKPKAQMPNQNDGTEMARRNFAHNNRIKQSNAQESGRPLHAEKRQPTSNINDGEKPGGLSGLGARLKNSITNGLTKGKSKNSIGKGDGKGGKNLSNSFKGAMKRKILSFLATHPFAIVVIVAVLLILIMLLISSIEDMSNSKNKKGTHCTYNLNGVTLSGSVELSNLKVELINCDGTESDYTVLETVDFEKYVLGVALAEIGPDSPAEAIKAQIIAARGFALTRNSGMCPGNPDNCFYGYNTTTGKIRMRACEADQVYWDYDKDIYRQDRGSISIYSPEINSGTLWKSALSEQKKQELLALASQVKGEVLVDSSDKVISTNYVASTSEQFISGANAGNTYDKILADVYDTSSSLSKATCTSYGNIDYGDYILSSDGTEILHQPLENFLSSNGTSLEEFNALIAENVDNAGYGTRAGVVAAAVTLIAELGNNYGVKVPYYWGGGHYDGVVEGALGYWGSTQCHTYANNTSYNYCGLDCSGFVPWAIKNGGFNMVQNLAGNFQNLPGVKRVSLSNSAVLEPGDLLESSGHIVLVVGVEEESNVYICAEASGNSAGVLFTRRSFTESGYWGVKMDGYYDTQARSK